MINHFYQLLKKLHLNHFAYTMVSQIADTYFKVVRRYNKLVHKTATIVLYHRITSITHDPHQLCVSPGTFNEHLQYYKNNYRVISLSELVSLVTNKSLVGNELVITFDDGYQDNLDEALPLLEKHSTPATIFITTGNLGNVANFSWDNEYKETERGKFLTPEEIKQLDTHPLIEIGAHTHSHIKLASLSPDKQVVEITRSKTILESIVGHKLNCFAFPFGGFLAYTKDSFKALHTADFKVNCTTIKNSVTNNTPLLSLPRINIREYTTIELADILC